MDWFDTKLSCVCIAGLLAVACGGDGDGDAGDDTTDATAPADTDTGTTDTPDTDTSDTGTSDTDTDTDTGSETGEPLPECPEGEDVSAAFTIEIDGEPITIDYSEFNVDHPGTPEAWTLNDLEPEIDATCNVTEQLPDSLTVTCIDSGKLERTFTVRTEASEALSLDVGEGPVEVWYMVNEEGDMLEHVSDTQGHSFVVSNDAGVVLAGIDGRYTVLGSVPEAWPAALEGRVVTADCLGRDQAEISLGADSIELLEGSAGDLGSYRAIVETAVSIPALDGEASESVDEARWLVGLPAEE